MAEREQEGTEQSTPRRLERAREQGQVPRSRDLAAAAVLFSSALALKLLGPYSGGQLRGMLSNSLALPPGQSLDESRALASIGTAAAHALLASAPLWGACLLAALAAPLAVGGWIFTLQELVPDAAERDVFLCGPPAMTEAIGRNLRAAGVPRRRVHVERFALT